jgi:plastocyanin
VFAPGYLDDIQVDGKPLEGFAPGTLDYAVKVPAGTTDVPVVTPVSNDPSVTIVSVEQATSIPGVATIVSQEGTFVNTYRIGFGYPPAGSSDFTTGELGPEWTILQDDGSWSLSESGLSIPTQEGDLPEGSAENVFLQPGSGDWLAETHFTLSAAPTQVDQQVAMTVYEDAGNHLKLAYQTQQFFGFVFRRFAFWKTEGGVTSQVASGFNFGQNTEVWLRIEKVGTSYRAWSSTNGTTFTARGATSAGLLTPNVGFLATNGAGSTADSITATIDSFSVDQVLIDPIDNPTVDEGDTVELTVSAADSAGHDVTLSSGDLPDGASFDPATGEFKWTPDYTQAGTYLVRFEATDGTYRDVLTICVFVEEVTPDDQVAEAIAVIEASGLNGGNKNALTVKLNNVLSQLDKSDPATAISIIEDDFVPQVQAFTNNGKLTADEGSALLHIAAELVANISQNSL